MTIDNSEINNFIQADTCIEMRVLFIRVVCLFIDYLWFIHVSSSLSKNSIHFKGGRSHPQHILNRILNIQQLPDTLSTGAKRC